MRLLLTGAGGFLGWHVACRLRALRPDIELDRLDRPGFADDARLQESVARCDVVLHVAGVNRADSDEEVREANIAIARRLAEAMTRADRPIDVVYANSTQADGESAYGDGKRSAADVLGAAARDLGGRLVDVVLPNLFGEHGVPRYNSFVATFCDLVVKGDRPEVHQDRTLSLLHVQDAAAVLIGACELETSQQIRPVGTEASVAEVLGRIQSMHRTYASGDIPPLLTGFDIDLFNTYRSFCFPQTFPRWPTPHSDERGVLFETFRSHGGTSQGYVSTTMPGKTRGEHYHLRKIERFTVVSGEARIELRKLFTDDVVTFELSGDRPGFVDMPTMWVHNITNVGRDPLVTAFWSDQLHDTERPDQYAERVAMEAAP